MTWQTDDHSPLIAFAGDWHNRIDGVQEKLQLLADAGVTRLHHVGDFAISPDRSGRHFLDKVNMLAAEADIRISVTPGNHEDWQYLSGEFHTAGPGRPALICSHISVLPRGFRWSQRGRSLLSFGGAASIDYEWRVPGLSWWLEELPTEADVADVRDRGIADVMITHDSPMPGTEKVNSIRARPDGWSSDALAYAAKGTRITTAAWEAANPQILVHGHFHLRDTVRLASGQLIVSLAKENDPGNVALLDLVDLSVMWLEGLRD